jgi:low temperature requirement protein LtrA
VSIKEIDLPLSVKRFHSHSIVISVNGLLTFASLCIVMHTAYHVIYELAYPIDIRHPSEQRQDKNMRESSGHLAEVDERPYVFGEDVDEDEFA